MPGQDANRAPEDEDDPPCVVTEGMLRDLYFGESDRLYRFLTRRVGETDAGEVKSQAFVDFFVWWPAHPDHPAPTAALYTIAQRRAVDLIRARGRTLSVEGGAMDLGACALAVHRDPFSVVHLRLDLRRALADLNERERRALQLHHLDGLTVVVCAELMGTGVDNVKRILKTALAKLRLSPRMTAYQLPVATPPQEVRK
ncbi:RNA polymerase sigma factor [Streptomyces sp. NPDC002730]|uniref:RNA polymerase sigma factor n=1 Tax=Streptomyces sp. NPDC002730 TaxID=3364662 RepID=UPI0036B724F6